MNAQLEMALRLGAHGICVDEGDATRLPVVEWFPDAACKLIELIAKIRVVTDQDSEALRKIAAGVPRGDAYRIESNPSLYILRTDPRRPEEFMVRFYAGVEEQMSMGLSEKLARRTWIDNAAAEAAGYRPSPGAVEKSSAAVRYDKKRNAIAQRIGSYERKHGRKKLRAGSPT